MIEANGGTHQIHLGEDEIRIVRSDGKTVARAKFSHPGHLGAALDLVLYPAKNAMPGNEHYSVERIHRVKLSDDLFAVTPRHDVGGLEFIGALGKPITYLNHTEAFQLLCELGCIGTTFCPDFENNVAQSMTYAEREFLKRHKAEIAQCVGGFATMIAHWHRQVEVIPFTTYASNWAEALRYRADLVGDVDVMRALWPMGDAPRMIATGYSDWGTYVPEREAGDPIALEGF